MTLRQKLEKLLKNFTHHHHSNEEDSAAAAKVDDVESSTSTLSKHDVEFLFEIDSADKLAEKSALKKLQKLEKTLRAQYLNNSELLALLEYTRLVKQLILLVDLTRECIRRLILEATNKPVVSSSTEEIRTHSSKSECEKCREAFLTLSYILMYLTYSSRIFRLKLAQFEGIKVLVDLLRLVDDDLLIQCTNNIPSEKKRCHELCVIVKNTLFIVQNMTKSVDLAPDDLEWLKSLSGKIVDNDDVPDLDSNEKMMMFLFLSRVMSSRELGEFKRKNEFVIKMIQLIKSVVSKISIGDQPLRMSIDTNEVYERVESMYLVVGNELAVSLVDLLDCIQVLSTKGVMPWELVRNLNLIDELAAILTHGNECEVEHVLKIILSFGLEQSLYNENDILVIAKNILISQKFENRRIINCCKGIIWLNEAHYKDYICSEETQPNEEDIESTTAESKIFLCCDRNDVKFFEEIESELEKLGHKSIRTRYSNSYEPSLEQILTCINNSNCVLIGISPHIMTNCCCRLEIQFAQKINKLIVPVILDSSYEINGWLKQLINDTDVYQLDAIENSSWEDEMKRLNEFIKRKIELESESITSSL